MVHDVDQARTGTTDDQRRVLDLIWHTYYRNKGNTWPSVQDVQIDLELPFVEAAIEALPPGTVFEENERYQIGLFGALLTNTGVEIERLLVDYIDYVRLQRKGDPTLKVVQSRDVATALKLSEDEVMILASALQLGQLAGARGAGGGPIWAAGLPSQLAKLMPLPKIELGAFVRDHASKMAAALAAARAPVPMLRTQIEAVVPAHTSATTSAPIERALDEIERALSEGRPAVGVDRIHTAFHAYLRAMAESAGLEPPPAAGVDEIFSLLRRSHPRLQATGPRAGDITKILRAMAKIVDALSSLRNKASLAHPPEEDLLADPEAMLVIHAVRTLLHYVGRRVALAPD